VNPDGTIEQAPAVTEAPAQAGETFGADSDAPGAMVCHTAPAKFKAVLEAKGFHVHTPSTHQEAINDLRLNNYRVVLVTADFEKVPHEQAGVHQHMQELPMGTRRKLFVVYVAPGAKSYDNMEAFANSVNLIANPEDAAKENFGDHIIKGLKANDAFYKVFFESMTALGKS
jgi:hypothetical protein